MEPFLDKSHSLPSCKLLAFLAEFQDPPVKATLERNRDFIAHFASDNPDVALELRDLRQLLQKPGVAVSGHQIENDKENAENFDSR